MGKRHKYLLQVQRLHGPYLQVYSPSPLKYGAAAAAAAAPKVDLLELPAAVPAVVAIPRKQYR
jgi:hypothetical protein